MSHLANSNSDLVSRIRRIGGQVSTIERALRADADCGAVLHLAAAVRGAVNGFMDEIIADHLAEHVAKPDLTDTERAAGAAELLAVIRRYSK